ncbi:iron-containing redox enzyme family protein [Sphaerisporangium sp. B11E5]|uniref:iron-containing redox enzyme family protein n=1 Tax=Sphaerisporangium sp. B11E5 TaxID=3153563 RepID=UPI00325CD757
MRLPVPRGPISERLFGELARPPHAFGLPPPLTGPSAEPRVADEDVQVALFACYEMHYQGFDEVDERWEWNRSVLAVRERLEDRFERALAAAVPRPPAAPARDVPRLLVEMVPGGGPWPLADYLHKDACLDRFREFVVHRSLYHLKEADPHTWAIPRLRGPVKAALVEIQADEYGGGRAGRMHSELFRGTMRALGLDDAYGAYADRVPAVTLAVDNAMSMFGLHRRHRGRLLGGSAAARRYYDEHVQADAVHEQIAVWDMCGRFAAGDPGAGGEVLYGAACALTLDRLFAEHVMDRWRSGASSLREPHAVPAGR